MLPSDMKLSISVQTFEGVTLNPGQIWATPRIGEWKHCTQNSVLRVGWCLNARSMKLGLKGLARQYFNFTPSWNGIWAIPLQASLPEWDEHGLLWFCFSWFANKKWGMRYKRLIRADKTYYREEHRFLEAQKKVAGFLTDKYYPDIEGDERYFGCASALSLASKLIISIKNIRSLKTNQEVLTFVLDTLCTLGIDVSNISKDRLNIYIFRLSFIISNCFMYIQSKFLRQWLGFIQFVHYVAYGKTYLLVLRELLSVLIGVLETCKVTYIPQPRRVKRRTPLRIRPPIQPNAPGF